MSDINIHDGWVSEDFNDIVSSVSLTGKKIKSSEYKQKGLIPIIDQGKKFVAGYTDDLKSKITIKDAVVVFGDHTRSIKFIDFDFAPGADGTKVLTPNKKIIPKYLYYYIKSLELENKGYSRHFKILKQNKIIFPEDKNLQKRIIKKLDDILEKLEKKKKEILNLQEKNQEKIKYLNEKLADNTIDQIIHFTNIQKNWECATIEEFKERKYIIEFQDGNHGELHPKKADFTSVGRPFITAKQIDDKGNLHLDECKRLPEDFCQTLRIGFTEPNDILFTHNATVGRVSIMPPTAPSSIVGTSVTYYRLNPEKIFNKFFFYLLRSRFIRNQYEPVMKQTTRNQFSKLKQAKLNLVIPSLDEQEILVNKLEKLFSQMNDFSPRIINILEMYKLIISELEYTKKSILKYAFSGKLVN
jgi:type I restriction enzyme, S subunit